MSDDVLTIDGALGEGGGQVLRTGVGLAGALWGRPRRRTGDRPAPRALAIRNIRANRPRTGLAAQHLAAVRAAAKVTGGAIEGDRRGSRELTFRPREPAAGDYRFEIGTAGSAMLVLQTVLPALVAADGESEVTITGGTHNPFAPCFEYVRDVLATLAEAANVSVALTAERAGFYPAGGGRVRCAVMGLGSPANVAPLRLASRGELRHIEGVSAAAEALPEHVVERQLTQTIARLRKAGLAGSIEQARWSADSPGTVVFLRAVFSRSVAGFFALGRKGKPAERVADEAVDQLLEFLDAEGAVDPHAADQLITLLALSGGRSELTTTRLSNHLLTNAEVVRRITGREVTIEGRLDSPGKVTLEPMAG